MNDSKYVIGIDLGTTNCAMSYISLSEDEEGYGENILFEIPQVVKEGQVEERNTLPSFMYIPGSELPAGSVTLPWDKKRSYAVGEFARDYGSKVPHRLISSAKSWLCNPYIDRKSALLPWKSPDEVKKYSPLTASSLYLLHMKEAWNQKFEEEGMDSLFENQDIILTVPASFDAVAREYTVEAASKSGFKVTLLEEPQSAFYSWLSDMGNDWRKEVKVGDLILVCDVGGGTTDLSLIAVREIEGNLEAERIAVGEHILLGGDNMDLALAVKVQERLKEDGIKLDNWQFQVLTHECRVAKEELLENPDKSVYQVVIPGRGSKLIGGSIKGEVHRKDLEKILLEGFFPLIEVSQHPKHRQSAGLKEIGLPYASEPAITKHLAKFLTSHVASLNKAEEGKTFAHPTAILFNGGVFNSEILQKRIMECINSWLASEGSPSVKLLEGRDLDLAVSFGASYYGLVRRGDGIRIRGGAGSSYYIGLQTSMPAIPGMEPPIKALCVVPYGMEEGTYSDIPEQDFGLVVGEKVGFSFLKSSTRRDEEIGDIIEDWEDMDIHEISNINVTLQSEGKEGKLIPVKLHSNVTEVGTLELSFVEKEGNGNWKLEFDVRENI